MMAAPLDPTAGMIAALLGRQRPALAGGPAIDVIERRDEVLVRAAVPGMKKEDLDISVSGTLFTLRGEAHRAPKEKEEDGEYYCREIPLAFSRTLVLPAEVDESKAHAVLKEGVLEVRLPKPAHARASRIRID